MSNEISHNQFTNPVFLNNNTSNNNISLEIGENKTPEGTKEASLTVKYEGRTVAKLFTTDIENSPEKFTEMLGKMNDAAGGSFKAYTTQETKQLDKLQNRAKELINSSQPEKTPFEKIIAKILNLFTKLNPSSHSAKQQSDPSTFELISSDPSTFELISTDYTKKEEATVIAPPTNQAPPPPSESQIAFSAEIKEILNAHGKNLDKGLEEALSKCSEKLNDNSAEDVKATMNQTISQGKFLGNINNNASLKFLHNIVNTHIAVLDKNNNDQEKEALKLIQQGIRTEFKGKAYDNHQINKAYENLNTAYHENIGILDSGPAPSRPPSGPAPSRPAPPPPQ